MAQLAVSAAGAGVGFLVGGPVGAQIGWAAGSIAGSLLFPQRQDVPQVGDLNAPAVQYGTPILRLYGSNRISGALAWYSPKRVIAGGSGGKGTPDAPTPDTAEIDLLIVLSHDSDMTGIARVWKNKDLVWTAHAGSDDDSRYASSVTDAWTAIYFLDGNPAQLPHAVIEATEGAGFAPAYRYRQCVLIEGLQLGSSGQIPLLEFETVQAGDIDDDDAGTTQFGDNVAVTDHLPEPSLRPWGSIAFGSTTRVPTFASGDDGAGVIRCWDVGTDGAAEIASDTAVAYGYQTTPGIGSGNRAACVLGSRSILPISVLIVGDGMNAVYELPDVDNYLGADEIRFAVWGARIAVGTALDVGDLPPDVDGVYVGNRGRIYLCSDAGAHVATFEAAIAVDSIAMNGSTLWALNDAANLVYPFDIATQVADTPFACTGSAIFAGASGDLHYVSGSTVYRRDGAAWTDLGTMTGPVDSTHRFGATSAQIYAAAGDTESVEVPRYTVRAFAGTWPSRDAAVQAYADYWFNSFTWGAPSGTRETRGEVVTVTLTATGPGASRSWIATYACERLYGYPGDSEGNWDLPYDEWTWVYAETSVYVDESTTLYATDLYYHDLFRQPLLASIDPQTVDLRDIVEAEWGRVADHADLDASELDGIPVRGFQTAGSIRAALEELGAIFHFGAVCSDRLYMRLLGGAAVATIPFEDLAAGEGAPADEPFAPETADDAAIPERVALTYINQIDDYAAGTETGYRGSGSKVVSAQRSNVVMNASEAKKVAEVAAALLGTSNITAQISLSPYWAALEPTDPIIVPDEDGNTYRMRIGRLTYGGGISALELVRDDVSALLAEGITADDYTPSLNVTPAADTEIALLDIPILRDADDSEDFYAVAKGSDAGSRLYSSPDDVTYTAEVNFVQEAVFGTCATALGGWAGGWVFDEAGAVLVDVGEGELASTTRDLMIADQTANECAIGVHGRWELCQFRTATLISAGVYRLTGFLRGKRGTEWAMGLHAAGDAFVLLDAARQRVDIQNSELGIALYYKGVTVGRLLSSAAAVSFTDNGMALMPWAPVDVRVARDASDNATITWRRRTRLSTRFASALGISCPLGEASEAYEIDFYTDATFTTLAATKSASAETYTYSAAAQTSDGLTPGDPLWLRIFQLNATVGRGTQAEAIA